MRYHLRPQRRLSPFCGLALGITRWRVRDETESDSVGLFPDGPVPEGYNEDGTLNELKGISITPTLTLGAEYMASTSWAISAGVRYHALLGSDLDNIGLSALLDDSRYVDANSGLVEGFVGATLLLGASDADNDGMPNRLDACPDDPEDYDGYEDSDGCPDGDNDGDGIPDLEDPCPDQPEDKDGFGDSDGCPDPDNDGDGIFDFSDACPDEEEDKDGFQDSDGCPDPDNDGDGVLDVHDECPETPTGLRVDSKGCPVAAEIPTDLTLEGVNFLTGSAELTPTSLTVLEEVARSLLAAPDVSIEIHGHTDSSGPEPFNKELSRLRAEAVREVLIRFGVSAERMRAVGFGSEYPVAPNNTAEGRARNRRVEIHRLGP
jgi:outer membrane protein OmpA-like peptidoglycan-associated protein